MEDGSIDKKEYPYFQLKDKKMESPEIINKGVGQNRYEETVILTSDKKAYFIHTVGGIGCDAVLLLTIEPNGTEHVVITHYDPAHLEDHLALIKDKKRTHPAGKKFSCLVTFGDENTDWNKQIQTALSDYQGTKPDTISLPNLGSEQAREMIKPENRLNYQLLFVRGYEGNMKKHRVRVPKTNYEKVFAVDDLK